MENGFLIFTQSEKDKSGQDSVKTPRIVLQTERR